MSSPVIVALDLEPSDSISLANKLNPDYCKLKIGSQLFTTGGPKVITQLNELGFDIFLDLKFHDIPNTVYQAINSCISQNVWMINIHASGGKEMLKAAHKAVNNAQKKTLLVGVTVLTSLDESSIKEIGFKSNIADQVSTLARLCKDQKLDGVVCSPNEVLSLRKEFGEDFVLVCPGIRSQDSPSSDQKRIASPSVTIQNGAAYIVIGREITLDSNPLKKLKEILDRI